MQLSPVHVNDGSQPGAVMPVDVCLACCGFMDFEHAVVESPTTQEKLQAASPLVLHNPRAEEGKPVESRPALQVPIFAVYPFG